ncbi:tyrosine recombinase XerC [Yeguia hominis]|uniref:Tyrosine recombinase XerC n=1 Tax=Yeguia hominis TaxID=2763662 RepID=A0A926DBC4_9FIRM|nr:tyrosine recombinase XerC [Yeguia hominis]MBC8534684.1 tyrosine recombinase XerC [Yeguia hominis]
MKQDLFSEAPALVREFLGYQSTVKGRSPKTVTEYYLDLRTFFRYLKYTNGSVSPDTPFQEISIADVTEEMITSVTLTQVFEYMNFLISERDNHAASRQRKTSSLRMFYKFLTNQKHLMDVSPLQQLESPKQKKSLPKYLTLEQSLELLNAIDGPYKERDYCMITLFLNCGMRLSELVGLNLSDIRKDATVIRVVGKGNKERIVYLNDACKTAIQRYLAVRPHEGLRDRDALFISKQRKRISPKTVQYLVKKYLGEIDLKSGGYSVHKLRHTAATLMYQYGHVDIRVLKDILGHENLGTTEIYTHLSDKQMENAVNASPLAKVKSKK